MFQLLKQKIRRLHYLSKSNLDLQYKLEDLNDEYYRFAKEANNKELEHQLGRITNFKKIVSEIKQNEIEGDVIEFGTWQGFSLLWLSFLFERQAIFHKKIIGIDSFEGLPNSEGIFLKGAFSDTSKVECENNLKFNPHLYSVTKQNIFIEDFIFSKTNAVVKRIKEITPRKFCLIHVDSDISSSLLDVHAILETGDLIGETCYLLFDDYGCMESYQETVDVMLEKLSKTFTITEHSGTKLTKNFILKKLVN